MARSTITTFRQVDCCPNVFDDGLRIMIALLVWPVRLKSEDPVVRPVRPSMDLTVCLRQRTGKRVVDTCVFRSNIIRKTVSASCTRFSTRKYRIKIAFYCSTILVCNYFLCTSHNWILLQYRLRCSLLLCFDPVLVAPLVLVVASSRLHHPLAAVGLPLPLHWSL